MAEQEPSISKLSRRTTRIPIDVIDFGDKGQLKKKLRSCNALANISDSNLKDAHASLSEFFQNARENPVLERAILGIEGGTPLFQLLLLVSPQESTFEETLRSTDVRERELFRLQLKLWDDVVPEKPMIYSRSIPSPSVRTLSDRETLSSFTSQSVKFLCSLDRLGPVRFHQNK